VAVGAQDRLGLDRFVPLDWGSELWNWDVSAFESADGIRLAKTRSGRAFDDDDVLAEATFTLLRDVVDAAGGLEAAYKRFGVAVASAQERLDKLVAKTGFSKSSPEPELGWNFSDTTLEDAWYALEEMIIWARTFDDRLRHPAHDRRRYPDQGLIPALAAGPRRDAIITARSRLVGAYLNEVRYLAQLNLHMQSTKRAGPSTRWPTCAALSRSSDRLDQPPVAAVVQRWSGRRGVRRRSDASG
jgi:hypothetical protein